MTPTAIQNKGKYIDIVGLTESGKESMITLSPIERKQEKNSNDYESLEDKRLYKLQGWHNNLVRLFSKLGSKFQIDAMKNLPQTLAELEQAFNLSFPIESLKLRMYVKNSDGDIVTIYGYVEDNKVKESWLTWDWIQYRQKLLESPFNKESLVEPTKKVNVDNIKQESLDFSELVKPTKVIAFDDSLIKKQAKESTETSKA